MPWPEEAGCGELASSMERVWAREVMEVSGMRWDFMAWALEMRRSHSRARAVARCGFEGGMRRGVLVVGLRTARASRWTRWLDSDLAGILSASATSGFMGRAVAESVGIMYAERRTIVRLHTDVFPEALFHCCTGLHVACA